MIVSAIARLASRLAAYGRRRAGRKPALAALFACGLALAPPAAADPVTIAALGDSLTQGYGLPPEAGLVPQLQAWLDAHGAEVRLINAGVSGDTSAGGLARIDWTLTPEVQGLIVERGGNDMLRGLDPDLTRANLDAILKRAEDRHLPVLLVGIRAPGNYGPDYRARFDAIFPDLAEAHGALLYPDLLAPLDADPPAKLGGLMQADLLHPNAQGVAIVVDALGPAVLHLVERINRGS
jgi:acyl-CoA thioesterase-1